MDRETLGRIVREVWVAWAREQASPKPSWLVPWEGLSEADREVDRRIGETVAARARDAAAGEAARLRAALEAAACGGQVSWAPGVPSCVVCLAVAPHHAPSCWVGAALAADRTGSRLGPDSAAASAKPLQNKAG